MEAVKIRLTVLLLAVLWPLIAIVCWFIDKAQETWVGMAEDYSVMWRAFKTGRRV